jgi:integrase
VIGQGLTTEGEPKGLAMTSLSDFARHYGAGRRVTRTYVDTLIRRAAALELHAGQTSLVGCLAESPVNAFLASLDRRPATIRSYRTDLISLWHGAADLDLVPYPVLRRIYCPPVPAPLVECYTIEEVRALLAAAGKMIGRYRNGVTKRRYWPAAIRLAWDSGLRRGDCWGFRRELLRPDGSARLVQNKTGKVVVVRLRPSTVAALADIGGNQPLKWTLNASFFGRHFKRLTEASGVGRGSFKFLRRSSGSYVELAHPGAGHKHLGNGADVFARHYDARLGAHLLPMPPALD